MGQRVARFILAISIGGASLIVAAAAAGAGAPSSVPAPTVTTPPRGDHGHPFPDTLQNLGDLGYVQDEVFIDGTARSYESEGPFDEVTDGRWDATPTGPAERYTTRLLIRRPEKAADFNGTVLVEWLNVSAGFDLDSFDALGKEFTSDGDAYVGVSAQASGVEFLTTWDPARYSSLVHPGDSYSYDIFSQAAQAIRSSEPAPLGALTDKVDALIAWGGSQSGSRLFTYLNAVNPTAAVFDGFIPFITTGSTGPAGAPLSEAPLPDVTTPTGAQAVIRTDSSSPILVQNSESEFVGSARGLHSQHDSKRFRLWEYAGISHANQPQIEDGLQTLTANGIPANVFPPCGDLPLNDLSAYPAWRATLHAMDRWIRDGKAPTKAPRVRLTIPDDAAQPATIERDAATGLAKGGIRLPDVAVPTRTLTAERPEASLAAYPNCVLFGATDPWNGDTDPWDGDAALDVSPDPEPNLAQLYDDTSTYAKTVKATADRLVAKGFLLPADAKTIVAAAKALDIPQ